MAKVSGHGYIGFDTTGVSIGVLRIHDVYNVTAFPREGLTETVKDRMSQEESYSYLQAATLALINTKKK
jgi:hypothetical protein